MKITHLIVTLVISLGAFLGGAVSYKMCLGPFCKGDLYRFMQLYSVKNDSYKIVSELGTFIARDILIPDDKFKVNNYGSFFKYNENLLSRIS